MPACPESSLKWKIWEMENIGGKYWDTSPISIALFFFGLPED